MKFLTILSLSALLLGVTSCSNDDDNTNESQIESSELPNNSQAFVTTYFPNTTYTRVEQNVMAESDGSIYEVELSNGFEIDFDIDGDWVDIDWQNTAIPTGIITSNITTYVETNYPNLFIHSIDKETTGYEIELSNGQDLIFSASGEFVRLDN